MRKINILYWLILPILAWFCYSLMLGFSNKASNFFGYTENNETQINLDFSAVVSKIHIIPGQKVKKGDLLMEMDKKSLDKEIDNFNQSIAIVNNKNNIQAAEIITNIQKIKSDKETKVQALKNEIAVEEAKITYNRSLLSPNAASQVESFKTIHPSEEKIASLKKDIAAIETSTISLLDSYNSLLTKMKSTNVETKNFVINKEYIIQEKNKLKIIAPFDGLIGSINVKNSEFVQAYATLVSFYEQSPVNVIGYINESLSVNINIGDSVLVKSILHPSNIAKGVVTAKGHRIIEIPERLRKIPEYKTYGMEVFITIPRNNNFLQKETVNLNIGNSKLNF